MEVARATQAIAALHDAQNALYGDGEDSLIRVVLAPEIRWTVPGHSPIAGTYLGFDAVVAYMHRRRALAHGTFRMHRRDLLIGQGGRGCRPHGRHGHDPRGTAAMVDDWPLRPRGLPDRRMPPDPV